MAMDVQPKILVSHLAHLCNSRGVPMVPINGGDGMGSLRLGEVLGLRTAVVIGVKVSFSIHPECRRRRICKFQFERVENLNVK